MNIHQIISKVKMMPDCIVYSDFNSLGDAYD